MKKDFKTTRPLWLFFLLSVLLHLGGLYLASHIWLEELETESFRARLANVAPLFKPRRLVTSGERRQLPQVEMHYVAPERRAAELREPDLRLEPQAQPLEAQAAPLALREIAAGVKEDEPVLERVEMPSPSGLGPADSMGIPSMDLLRIADMARADKDHAAVIIDPGSRRDLRGYINFAQLRVYGAGSGRGALEALARYLRDHTRILARVRDDTYEYFLAEELLEDPVHFLFEGGGLIAYRNEVLTQFSREEKEMLGRYLRGGGFLFIEGSNRYLREMAAHLRAVLGREARLRPLPVSHPLYHAFFDFGGGFPGEDKSWVADVGDNPGWYYPAQVRTEQPAAGQVAFFNPLSPEAGESAPPPPQGLWGVEMEDGRLVAVLSDMGLHQKWRLSLDSENSGDEPVLYALMAGANIVAYALTREGGRTPHLPPPAWMQQRPPSPPPAEEERGREVERLEADADLFAVLDASIAVVQAPLGAAIEGDLGLRLDGRYGLELLRRGYHGVILHNVPVGEHWLELRYGGHVQQVEFSLRGGQVLTIHFALNRFAFLSQLRVEVQAEQVAPALWRAAFSDLVVEEIYLAEERQWLQQGGSAPEVP